MVLRYGYEPHYLHYKDDFGKTFAGFFSDEPCVGNTLGFDWTLVEENFSRQIGDWCQARGVEYIGHIVEDNNQHSRLGSSMGHFFRAMAGQHMAGIDDIGGQVLPNGEDHTRRGLPEDGEFYHFALGKLGSSYGHIDPRKQGRTMCEIFGAYGWSESVPMMKYIADHFLVRGVNYFVPHAFTGKAFPDPDCPPHFYAHGENPQYRHFGKLCRYMNRVSNLISGGTHVAPAAILYHGEAEWTGRYMYLQKPARVLLENQIDFDVLPSDLFEDMDMFRAEFDGMLHVNGETYRALIIPYAQYITSAVAQFAAEAAQKGFPVLFLQGLPEGICDSCSEDESTRLIEALSICQVLELDTLAAALREKGIFDIELSKPFRRLRYYHYQKNGDVYMMSNEDAGETWSGVVKLPISGELAAYDAMENVLRQLSFREVPGGTEVDVVLEPYQSLLITNAAPKGQMIPAPVAEGTGTELTGPWTLRLAEAKQYPEFQDVQPLEALQNIGRRYPDFSGYMRYETEAELTAGTHVLEAESVYDCAELYVNGEPAGMRICPPYRWDISKLVRDGVNQIRIDVANTLDRKVRSLPRNDPFAGLFGSEPLNPSGIVGAVTLYSKKGDM